MTEHAQAAKAIRQELKKAFPNIKFTVRSSSFSMGDDVRIDYVNGVPSKEVEKIVNKYQAGQFDGMQDLYEYNNRRSDIPQVKYVLVQREISQDVREAVKQRIAKEYGIKDINNSQEWFDVFHYWNADSSEVWRELSNMTI